MPDHFEQGWFAVGPALVAAACATTTLRVGSLVYSNTSGIPPCSPGGGHRGCPHRWTAGFGIGAGYYLPEYSQTGIELPPARARIDGLQKPYCHQWPLVERTAYLRRRALHHR